MIEHIDYYVYIYFRLNGIPCYVGKGRRYRWLEHPRLGDDHYNKHFAYILKNAGGILPCVIVRSGLTNDQAIETEIALIAAIGRGKNGPLVNLTDGGEGTSGWKHSAKAKAAITKAVSERVILDSTREKLRKANTGKIGTPKPQAFKDKMRAFHTGRVKSAEECFAISRSKMGHEVTVETRAKISAALAGKALSEETRRKISDGHKTSLKVRAHIQALADKFRGVPRKPEHIEKARLANIGARRSDESRARMSAAQKRRKHEKRIIIADSIVAEAMAGPRLIVAVAKKYGINRRVLNSRILELRRVA